MRRRALLIALFVAAVVTAWVTAFQKFPFESGYNSDSAIPVLMANWDSWSLFHLYYFGQDRYGALPFLLMQLVHAVTGLWWTAKLMTIAHIGAALATAWPVSLLFKRRAPAAMAALAVLLVMGGAFHTFNISQPYGWQLPLFFGAWAALRSFREQPTWRRFGVALSLAFCASWISALSAPLLLACTIAEAFATPRQPGGNKRRAALFAPVFLAGGLEGVVRGVFQVYSKKNYGHSFVTNVKMKVSGAGEALSKLIQDPVGPGTLLTIFTAAVGVYAVVMLARSLRKKLPVSDVTVTLAGLSAAFLGHMLLVGLGDHFRKNDLDARYLVLAECLAWLCVVQVALASAERWLTDARELILTCALALAVLAAPFWVQRHPRDPDFEGFREQADALVKRTMRGSFIVSGYWQVFAVAGLAPPGHLLPMVTLGSYNRTIFLRERIASADEAWISDGGADAKLRTYADKPYTWVEGAILARDASTQPIVAGGHSWHRFVATSKRRLSLEPRKACDEVRFAPTEKPELFVLFYDGEKRVPAKAFDAQGNEVALEAPQNNGDLFWFTTQSHTPIARVTFEPAAECPVQDVVVLGPPR